MHRQTLSVRELLLPGLALLAVFGLIILATRKRPGRHYEEKSSHPEGDEWGHPLDQFTRGYRH